MKHKSEKGDGSLIATTPWADAMGPDMVLGMRQSEAWLIADALRLLAESQAETLPAGAKSAKQLRESLLAQLRGPASLRAV